MPKLGPQESADAFLDAAGALQRDPSIGAVEKHLIVILMQSRTRFPGKVDTVFCLQTPSNKDAVSLLGSGKLCGIFPPAAMEQAA